jgi:hypothetical protein
MAGDVGWFGGVNAAPWAARADMLLNLDRTDSVVSAGNKSNSGSKDFRLTSSKTWAMGDKFGVTGRIGAFNSAEIDPSNNGYKLGGDSAYRPTYGMGLRYDVNSSLRLQGGWDRYHLSTSLRPGDGEVDLLTIGLKYRF